MKDNLENNPNGDKMDNELFLISEDSDDSDNNKG